MAYNNPELPDFENEYEYENEVANYQVEINLGPVQVGNITELDHQASCKERYKWR